MILKFLMMQELLIKYLFLVFFLIFGPCAFSNDGLPETDLQLLSSRVESKQSTEEGSGIEFLKAGEGRPLVRYNPVTLTFGGLMYVYQRMISPQMPSECLYHTSCSAFSKSLITEYGLLKGLVATADRLMRCNRVAVLDIHPMHIHEHSGKVVEGTELYARP